MLVYEAIFEFIWNYTGSPEVCSDTQENIARSNFSALSFFGGRRCDVGNIIQSEFQIFDILYPNKNWSRTGVVRSPTSRSTCKEVEFIFEPLIAQREGAKHFVEEGGDDFLGDLVGLAAL